MLSYHNDANLKSLIVAEMRKHKEQDQFLQGTYEKLNGKFKGCAVGCAIDSMNVVLGKSYKTSNHNVFEEALGIPEWLAHLQDKLFEGLPNEESAQFAVDFLDSIPVGVSLEPVKYKFCAFLMRECIERVLELPDLSPELREKVLSAIRGVLKLHEDAIETGNWDLEGARVAREAAWAARCAAAEAVGWGVAETAAWAAEAAARVAVVSAAWAAADWAVAAAWAAPRSVLAEWAAEVEVAYKRYSGELIKLLKEQS